MKIDLNQVIRDARGNPMPDGGPDAPPFTLCAALFRAMNTTFDSDNGMPAEKQRSLYLLTMKVAPGGEVDLSAEDIVLLKERVSKAFHFMIVGRCHDLLDPTTEE